MKNIANKKELINKMNKDKNVSSIKQRLYPYFSKYKYTYNFSWWGVPIIQFPQDMIAMQEIIYHVKPDYIIETGIAHGGSLIFYASLLESLHHGKVIGVDIDIRAHNRTAIENHPMFQRIDMIEGASTDPEVILSIKKKIQNTEKVIVCLDSNHTHDHVLNELKLYSSFVTKGSYLIVFDTLIEDLSDEFFQDRPWKVGNNPKTAVKSFLENNKDFEIDYSVEEKLLITCAPNGYLKRVI